MDIPLKDTPTPRAFLLGYGGKADAQAVADCMALLRVAKKLLAHFHQRFEAEALSPGKYSVLMELLVLDSGESLAPSELAERIGVTRPTITGLVDGLVKQGLVTRTASTDDRRKQTVALTASGRKHMKRLLPRQLAAMAAIVDPLAPKERASLRRLLQKVEEGFDGSRR